MNLDVIRARVLLFLDAGFSREEALRRALATTTEGNTR